MEEYQRRFIHDRVQVAEADVRELFNRFNTSLRASHIHASTRDEADSVHALIQAGAPFEPLARSRFKSPDLARSGGDLGYFTVDEMDIAFEDMAFRMKVGEISPPVATSTGYSIIKLTDRLTVPILTETQFAEKAESLAPLALEQKRELATRRDMREHITRFRFDEAVIRRLWQDVGKDPEAYAAYRPELTEIPLRIDEAGRNLVIARDGRFSFTVGQWMEEAWYTPVERRQAASTFSDFREQVEAMAYRRFAMELLRHHPGLDRSYVDGSVAETFYSYLFDRFERQVDAAVSVADAEIRAEWERNSRAYIKPMEYNFQELMLSDSDQAERVVEQLRAGADFQAMLNRYGLNMESKKRGGELGFIPVDQFGAIQTRIVDVEPGQIVGPFQLESNRYVIFRLLDRRAARPMTFGEAAPVIRAGVHRAKRDAHRSMLLSEARSRHRAVIHYSKLHSITFEL
jgi:parvulin-like peptidyl-prolyl isomerase